MPDCFHVSTIVGLSKRFLTKRRFLYDLFCWKTTTASASSSPTVWGVSGYAALLRACPSSGAPDEATELLLLDIMLPEEDGLILQRLRSAAATKKLPVIILTAKNTEYDRAYPFTAARTTLYPSPSA